MQGQVIIGRVTDVQPHPDSDKLDIVTIAGKTNVANRPSPDEPRYKIGEYAAVLTEDLILPDWLLHHLDLWDDAKQKGVLAGSKGNRTKARRIAGVLSEVALCKVDWWTEDKEPLDTPGFLIQYLHVGVGDMGKCVMRVVGHRDPNLAPPPFTPEGIDIGYEFGVYKYMRD